MIIFHWNCVQWLQCCIVRISVSLMTWGKIGDDGYQRKACCDTELAQTRAFMITQGKKARVFSPHSKPHSPHTVFLSFFFFKQFHFLIPPEHMFYHEGALPESIQGSVVKCCFAMDTGAEKVRMKKTLLCFKWMFLLCVGMYVEGEREVTGHFQVIHPSNRSPESPLGDCN